MEAIEVQHHHAHALAVWAEHRLDGPVLAFACNGNGNGYGGDGTVWGGEVLLVDGLSIQRVGSLRPFMLPGGENAMREPRRYAACTITARHIGSGSRFVCVHPTKLLPSLVVHCLRAA